MITIEQNKGVSGSIFDVLIENMRSVGINVETEREFKPSGCNPVNIDF